MKRATLLVMLMVGVHALSFSHDSRVIMVPGEERAMHISVFTENESGVRWVRCSSDLQVSCPGRLVVEPGKELDLPVTVLAERGRHTVDVSVGDYDLQFLVESTNQTHVFYERLVRYNSTFARLEERYGPHELTDLGKELVAGGFDYYEEGDYLAVEGTCDNARAILEDYYRQVPAAEEEVPAGLNTSLLTLLAFGGLVAAYHYKGRGQDKGEKKNKTEELMKLVERETGG